MIDAVRSLGELVFEQRKAETGDEKEAFLKSLVEKKRLRRARKEGEKNIIKLVFSLDRNEIEPERESAEEAALEKYLWLGNEPGNKPQRRLTTDNADYLLRSNRNSIDNIIKEIETLPPEIKEKLRNLYHALAEVSRIVTYSSKKLEEIRSTLKTYKDAVLYTVSIKRNAHIEDLASNEAYKEFLYTLILRPYKSQLGICHVCGENKSVLNNPDFPAGSILKVYVTDKRGFLQGLPSTDALEEASRFKTFSICQDCLKFLLIGENYISQKLTTRVGEFDVCLIPKCTPGVLTHRKIEGWTDYIAESFGAVKSFKAISEFEKKLKREYGDFEKESRHYTLHLIFGRAAQSKFDFKLHVQEVPVTRLSELREKNKTLREMLRAIFHGDGAGAEALGFEEISRIFPIRVSRREANEWKPLLALFSSLLTGEPYPLREVIRRALLLARIHKFGVEEGYSVRAGKEWDYDLTSGIVKVNLLIRLLRELDALGERLMEEGALRLDFDEELNRWFETVGYIEWQKALFLLGMLVGKIGIEQYKMRDESKAVLNKINFEGMPAHKVIQLSNEVLKGLRNYRILSNNEALYGKMKSLLDRNLQKLEDPAKNTFYILSGYSYETMKAISGKGE